MASSHLELKQDSVYNSNNLETHDIKDEEDDSEKTTVDVAKDALLEALFSKNHQVIDSILQNHPGLVNLDMCQGIFAGTPLQITCSMYHDYQDGENTGIYLLSHTYASLTIITYLIFKNDNSRPNFFYFMVYRQLWSLFNVGIRNEDKNKI